MVTDVKEGKVFVDYKDEGVHAVPLKASGWNCSTNTYQEDSTDGICLLKITPKQKQEINLWVY